MTIFDRFAIRVVAAGVGLCGAAMAFSPDVAAAPLTTGGYECIQPAAGQAGGAPAAAPCLPATAPVADMAGIPMALPGPVPIAPPVPVVPVLPIAPPLPIAPVVPAGAGAPVAAGAPVPVGLIDTANGYAGKGDRISPTPVGGPLPGQPIPAGPSPAS